MFKEANSDAERYQNRLSCWQTMWNISQYFRIMYFWTLISVGNSDFDEEVYKLTNEIIGKYFRVYNCLTFAADDVGNVGYLKTEIPKFVINLSDKWWTTSKSDLLREAIEQTCSGVIVQTNKQNRLEVAKSFKTAKTQTIGNRYNVERYLFLSMSAEDTHSEFLYDSCMYFLPRILFISREASTGRYLIQTHQYFDPERSDRVELLDTWTSTGGFERGADLFPDKVKNLKGRTLWYSVMPYIPYSVILNEGNNTIFDGIEARIGWEFLKIVNGSFGAINEDIELWGLRFDNGTGTGIFGSVLRHDVDFGYSAIYQWDCDVLDCTYPFIIAEMLCLAPKPRVLTNWMTMLLPFNRITWIGLCLAYVISSAFVYAVGLAMKRLFGHEIPGQHTSTLFQTAYTLFRLQLHQIPSINFKSNPIAVYLRIVLLFYFIVSVFWQGGIAAIMTVPRYEKPIDTPEDLVAQWPKVEWGSVHDAFMYSIKASTDPVLMEIVRKYKTLDNATLVRRSKTRDFAFFLEKLPNNHYGFNDYINEETVPHLRIMKEYIYTGFVVMILPRGSPFTAKMDDMLHWLVATGITQKLENQVSLERINNHLQLMIQHSVEKDHNSIAILTVEHILGALYIYFVGIVISTAAFIVEKFCARRELKKVKSTSRSSSVGRSLLPFAGTINFRADNKTVKFPKEQTT